MIILLFILNLFLHTSSNDVEVFNTIIYDIKRYENEDSNLYLLDSTTVDFFIEECFDSDYNCRINFLNKYIKNIIPKEIVEIINDSNLYKIRNNFIFENKENRNLKNKLHLDSNIKFIPFNFYNFNNFPKFNSNIKNGFDINNIDVDTFLFYVEKKYGTNPIIISFSNQTF